MKKRLTSLVRGITADRDAVFDQLEELGKAGLAYATPEELDSILAATAAEDDAQIAALAPVVEAIAERQREGVVPQRPATARGNAADIAEAKRKGWNIVNGVPVPPTTAVTTARPEPTTSTTPDLPDNVVELRPRTAEEAWLERERRQPTSPRAWVSKRSRSEHSITRGIADELW